ncbi:MAG: hypothetical protein KDD47_12980, partial [Acidobacteria bacterium]|nr:hypothetical protein [Acidobacteriota bacterium]
MTLSSLPFDLLGQVGPILAWTEGRVAGRLPTAWSAPAQPFKDRERAWLLGELPTYSYDNVDDIVAGARGAHRRGRYRPASLPREKLTETPRLSPPKDFDLLDAFRFLNEYFFQWNGTEPCIRDGRMEDLHELGLRLPMGHVVRHAHARTVAEGVMSFDEALRLPELVTLLPSNSFGMRNVVRKGLSESHLHLRGVISAEETWADNLLKPIASGAIRGSSQEERRLLVLNLFAGRLLALAVWMSLVTEPEPDRTGGYRKPLTGVRPRRLLGLMDEIYFARTEAEEREASRKLRREILTCVTGLKRPGENSPPWERLDEDEEEEAREKEARARNPGGPDEEGIAAASKSKREAEKRRRREELRERRRREEEEKTVPAVGLSVEPGFRFLLRWISPTSYRMDRTRTGGRLPGNAPEDMRRRLDYVHRLHLAAHLQLVRLSIPQMIWDRKKREKKGKEPKRFV